MVAQAKPSLITNVPPSFYVKTGRETKVWLDAKRNDDNVEGGLWRIHNTLYDLNDFIGKHPGGPSWLEMTKGHDVTEAFMTHHMRMDVVEPHMMKYRVKETNRPRNVKLTFAEDGFYMSLKRKVVAKLPEINKKTKIWSEFYIDGLFVLTLITAILAQRFQSITMAILCGLFLTWTGICGHNYLHRRDNYRMFYFNIIFQSFRDWRISHALSHHLYPNSLLDIELISYEPFLVWVPSVEAKNWIQRYAAYAYSPIFYCCFYFFEFGRKIFFSIVRGYKMHIDEFMPFIIPITMYLFGGNHTFVEALKMFLIVIMSGGFIFSIIGINAGHHHPEVVHDGDPVHKSYDWGLYSVDTVMERKELRRGNTLLALANFGDHALHHLFPTLDHGILHELYDDFFETLLQFEAECQCYPWFFETIKGQFKQLSRTEPMKLDSHERYLLKYSKPSKSE
ncbi:cytochrome b5-related protein-like [Sitodiplosis mosellana]|uniref:cytochrome b5-related protein-like n=1 Tax=Sitodiplosis mosellana TaxID=263140 RepID=UPI0024441179|nr:cytochrome b5-related protein-like [Sitodiplosis mosellana]